MEPDVEGLLIGRSELEEMIIQGLRQERRCLKRFLVFVRHHTRFGLGRLQTGDVVEERRGWRPPPLDPSPPPGKSGMPVS